MILHHTNLLSKYEYRMKPKVYVFIQGLIVQALIFFGGFSLFGISILPPGVWESPFYHSLDGIGHFHTLQLSPKT